jgi:SAM-dependent methyltransferase
LSEELVARLGLRGRRIVEVGCGQGEFLALLCRLGPNEGIGFDPVIDEARGILGPDFNTRAVAEWFDEHTPPLDADLVCCKMTLEHIDAVAPFVRNLRRALRPGAASTVFAQVPESLRILRSCAFEDVYYEHCSYFTPGTLARLFRAQGFEVDRLQVTYGGQYLSIEAHAAGAATAAEPLEAEEPVAEVAALVADFPRRYAERTAQWRSLIESRAGEGPVALWGSGSKAVSFMKSLGLGAQIEHVVDVNPYRQGRYIACTGQRILAPSEIAAVRPRAVVVMNAVYREEIGAMLADMGVTTEVLAL